MYLRLLFSGKIKINIRFLVPFKTHKSGKRNVVAVLLQSSPALRAIFRGKVDSGQLATGLRKLAVPAVRTKIMRRQGINLGNSAHCSDKRRADRTPGADRKSVV